MTADDRMEQLRTTVAQARLPFAFANSATEETVDDRQHLVYRILNASRMEGEEPRNDWIKVAELNVSLRRLEHDLDHLLDLVDFGQNPETAFQVASRLGRSIEIVKGVYEASLDRVAEVRQLHKSEQSYLNKVNPTRDDQWVLLAGNMLANAHAGERPRFGNPSRLTKLDGWRTAAADLVQGNVHGHWIAFVIPAALYAPESLDASAGGTAAVNFSRDISMLPVGGFLQLAETYVSQLNRGVDEQVAFARAMGAVRA